jgi:ATP-dependent 26S proteasome regulatory subunit
MFDRRFDRTISVDTPDIKGRDQIFRVHLSKLKLEKALEHYSGDARNTVLRMSCPCASLQAMTEVLMVICVHLSKLKLGKPWSTTQVSHNTCATCCA